MKKISIMLVLLLSIFVVAALAPVPAHATFIKDPNPGGEQFFILDQNQDVSSFGGSVGSNNPNDLGPIVNVSTIQNVNTGSGYANITPVDGTTLTQLTFTPEDDTKYGDFSFRGQLFEAGDVEVVVVDQNGQTFSFTFAISNANADFERIGIVSEDGQWLQSVSITSDGFKEVKQIDFSFQENPVAPIPEPSTFILFAAGLVGVGILRRRIQK